MSRFLSFLLKAALKGLSEALRRIRLDKQKEQSVLDRTQKEILEQNLDTSKKARKIEQDVSGADDDTLDEWMRQPRKTDGQ